MASTNWMTDDELVKAVRNNQFDASDYKELITDLCVRLTVANQTLRENEEIDADLQTILVPVA